MAEIHILFPPSGPPQVYSQTTPVLKDEHIFWCIHNENSDVKKVEIQFDGGAAFFPTMAGPRDALQKDLAARQFIWGKSPHVVGTGNKRDKYTIRGLSADGQGVGAELDPVIISDDP